MRITTKGQVTIPQPIRERLGLLPHTEVAFVLEGGRVYFEKVEGRETAGHSRGRTLVERMRRPSAVAMTTDEIMALTRGD